MKSNECFRLQQILRTYLPNVWTILLEKKTVSNGDDSIRHLFDNIFDEIVELKNTRPAQINMVEIESSIHSKINSFYNEDVEFNSTVEIEISTDVNAIRDYVLLKALIQTYKTPKFEVNEEFCKQNRFLNCMDYQFIDIINSKEYKFFVKFWDVLISRCKEGFGSVLNCLGPNYKLVSSFHRHLKNMFNVYSIKHMSININLKLNPKVDSQYDGPELTTRLLKFLIDQNGKKKDVPLKHLHTWREHVTQVNKILWSNWVLQRKEINHNRTNFKFAQDSSKKIIAEIEYINSICDLNKDKGDKYVQKVVSKLIKFSDQTPHNNTETVYATGIMNSLIGCLELHLNNNLCLIDPVEKNNLKRKYIEDDIEHLSYMKTAYEIMQKVMKYNYLGNEVVSNIDKEIDILELKKTKYQRKSAKRPEKCLYKEMSDEIKHFFVTNANSCNLMDIIDMVEEKNQYLSMMNNHTHQLEVSDVIKRLDLWITNSQTFLCHTLKKYSTYYKDFTQPIEYSLNTIRLGFESLKCVLEQKYNSVIKLSTGFYINIELTIKDILINILRFPTTSINLHEQSSKDNDLFHTILESVDSDSSFHFSLLKTKIKEIRNLIIKAKEIDKVTFAELNYVFKMCNQIWNEQEEKRKKSKENNEQLYTTMYVF